MWRLVRSAPKPDIDRECMASALAVDSVLLSPDASCWLTPPIMPITVSGILVGEVGAEELEWKESRSTVSEFSLGCVVNSCSIVRVMWMMYVNWWRMMSTEARTETRINTLKYEQNGHTQSVLTKKSWWLRTFGEWVAKWFDCTIVRKWCRGRGTNNTKQTWWGVRLTSLCALTVCSGGQDADRRSYWHFAACHQLYNKINRRLARLSVHVCRCAKSEREIRGGIALARMLTRGATVYTLTHRSYLIGFDVSTQWKKRIQLDLFVGSLGGVLELIKLLGPLWLRIVVRWPSRARIQTNTKHNGATHTWGKRWPIMRTALLLGADKQTAQKV